MATPTWTNPSSRYKTFLHILYEQMYLSVLYIKQIVIGIIHYKFFTLQYVLMYCVQVYFI